MKCLPCIQEFIQESVLIKHYIDYHSIDEQDFFFEKLFTPDTNKKTCQICNETFKNCRTKKNHMFLYHYRKYKHMGGNRTTAFPINVLERGSITYFSINFVQHKKFYDFFSGGIVDAFLDSVHEIFRPDKESKFQGYAVIINQQRGEIIVEDKRVWLTNSFNTKHFNDFVRGEIRDEITKRIIDKWSNR